MHVLQLCYVQVDAEQTCTDRKTISAKHFFFFTNVKIIKKRIPNIKFTQLKDRRVANQAELDKHL